MNFGTLVTGVLLALNIAGVVTLPYLTVFLPAAVFFLLEVVIAVFIGVYTSIKESINK